MVPPSSRCTAALYRPAPPPPDPPPSPYLHPCRYSEEQEDEELMRDEDGGAEAAGHRLQVQPSVITGGKMREYQLQGLNWLIHLYDNGINGILADEMVSGGGLGALLRSGAWGGGGGLRGLQGDLGRGLRAGSSAGCRRRPPPHVPPTPTRRSDPTPPAPRRAWARRCRRSRCWATCGSSVASPGPTW